MRFEPVTRVADDSDWAIPAAIFVSVQFAIGLFLSLWLGFTPPPPVENYLRFATFCVVPTGLFFLLREILRLFLRGEERPTRALLNTIRANRRKLLFAGAGFYLVSMQIAALTWLKSMLPLAVPFWSDPLLADIDRFIFGVDPWRLLYPSLQPFETLIDASYGLWFLIKIVTLIAVLACAPCAFKSRALLAYFFTVGVFGVAGQYALSSAGPIFYEGLGLGDRFADIPATRLVATERDYLWAVYLNRGASVGSGISAMPSIHVALAAWIAFTVQSLYRPLAIIGWAYFVLILIGSVYLGWHYAVDGLVAVVAAVVAWKISADYVGKSRQSLEPGGKSGDWTDRLQFRDSARDRPPHQSA